MESDDQNVASRPMVGIRIPPCVGVAELARAAAGAEAVGFDAVWFPDSQLLWRDVWLTIAAAAAATSTVRLGVAVTNFETRHATVTASAIRTVQEIAPERLAVGFGTGSSSLAHLEMKPTARARMDEGFRALRTLLSGEPYDLGGGPFHLRDASHVPPLYMAASGPKNLALAGAIADGVMILSGLSRTLLERSIGLVRAGALEAGRNPDDVKIVVAAFTHVTDDLERDSRLVKPLCADIVLRGGGQALEAEGIVISERPREDPQVYPDYRHAEVWENAVRVAGEVVSNAAAMRFAQTFCLMGDGSAISARIDEIAEVGVDEIYIQQFGSYEVPYELIDQFGASVLPPTVSASPSLTRR